MINNFLDFQWISLIVFVLVLITLVVKNKKNLELQKIIFPLIYAGLFRTNFGLKFINKFSKRFKEWIILIGYCGIGIGFVGMILIVVSIIQSVIIAISQPQASAGVALVLPQTTIPGIGFLPFWYWILALFFLILIHEFSHGIVAKAHGLKVKSSGLGFFALIVPLIPLAFVEPDEKQLEKAPDHVQYSIYAAGPFSNILSALIILLMFMFIFTPIDKVMTEPIGFSFDIINESYPSSALPENIIINRLNEEEINSYSPFLDVMAATKIGDEIKLGNETNSYTITTVESPDGKRSFVGIQNIVNEYKVKNNINKFWFGVYSWIKGLFKWLGLLSFFIGLANLLPIGPVDGGRMVKTFTDKLIKDKKKSNGVWIKISLFVLALLLFSLLFPWLRNFI